MSTSTQAAWPCVDVGGTSIRVLALQYRAKSDPIVVARYECPTPRGLQAVLAALSTALDVVATEVRSAGCTRVPALCLGTPGRYVVDSWGRRLIAPRSATNLEAFVGEFDNLDLRLALAQTLQIDEKNIFLDNDAIVQGRYLIDLLLRQPQSAEKILGHLAVCINPGTGLGGCVCEIKKDEQVEVFTDSHISELRLHPLSFESCTKQQRIRLTTLAQSEDLQLELQLGAQKYAQTLRSVAGKQAEDLISGGGIAQLMRAIDRVFVDSGLAAPFTKTAALLDLPVNGHLLSTLLLEVDGAQHDTLTVEDLALFVAETSARAMYQLTVGLHNGTLRKCSGFLNWHDEDIARLTGVTRFIIGGGVTATPLGSYMLKRVQQLWQQNQHAEAFILAQADVIADAGAMGAFMQVPVQQRLQLESLSK